MPTASQQPPAVVYLAVKSYGIEAFERFVASYLRHEAGAPHDLVVLAKQFDDVEDFAPYRQLLGDVPHKVQFVADQGFDLGSYFDFAANSAYHRFLFLNSLSELLATGWLARFDAALAANPGAVVGSSASMRSVTSEIGRMRFPGWPGPLQPLRRMLGRWRNWLWYPHFPNPHLRTNAIMLERTTIAALRIPRFVSKADTSRFESGWGNLSRQVWKQGGKVLVVDARGDVHDFAGWAISETFWAGDQQNLLVADRQTRMFEDADADRRALLNRLAWGPEGADLKEF